MQTIPSMKKMKTYYLSALAVVVIVLAVSCSKSNADTSGLYTPSNADVTSSATLQQLQQGRALYINNCGNCHGLYSPDNFSSSQWSNIMSAMGPNTSMTSTQQELVLKYVTKGR
jgi:mono/diheme cytochrome c family protein